MMKLNTPFLIFLLLNLIISMACGNEKQEDITKRPHTVTGTWKLITYADFDTNSGKWIYPYGDHPRGYFTYTQNGIVNLNISSEKQLELNADSAYQHAFTLGEILDRYSVGYFGTYTIDYENSTLIHHPEGGAIPWYIGTDQHRQFILKEDSLFIGDPTFDIGKRVLIRVE
jgi:hypothetical protein